MPSVGTITFSQRQGTGWRWLLPHDEYDVPIDPNHLDNKVRRLRLRSLGNKLEVYEHIGFLRWFGFNAINLTSTTWPPHDSCGNIFWQALKAQSVVDTSRELPWYTVKEPITWKYPARRHGNLSWTTLHPSTEKQVKIYIECNYHGIGQAKAEFVFPNDSLLEEICTIPSPGLSLRMKGALWCAKKLLGWPHFHHVTWPNGDSQQTLQLFMKHRALDILGAMSLLCKDGLLAGRIESRCSGHRADCNVAKLAFPRLVLLP
jgi:UDP-3-O-acyl-N-acetylglucosamine deacetylase